MLPALNDIRGMTATEYITMTIADAGARTTTPEQSARARREHTSGDLFTMSIGKELAIVVRREGESVEKVLIQPDGSVSARFRYLPEEDKWGSPWLIQDPQPGDDQGCGADFDSVTDIDLTGAQNAVLRRIESSKQALHGVGLRGDNLIILMPYDQVMIVEREITPQGRSRETVVV